MNDGTHISQEDLAFYAMQTLHGEELDAVRRHLEVCAECREELKEVAIVLIAFGSSIEQQEVSQRAEQRFLSSIASEKRDVRVAPVVVKSPRMSWMPWAIAAVLTVATVLLTARVTAMRQQLRQRSNELARLTEENVRSQKILRLLTERSAQRVTLTSSKAAVEPTGHAIYLADRGELIFQGNNLKPLAQEKTYELWIIPANGTAPIPAGLFKPDTTGFASVIMPPLPAGIAAKAFGVTIEDEGGSSTPTAPIILAGT